MPNLTDQTKDRTKWKMVINQSSHEFGKYLRYKSNGTNDWTWKPMNDSNIFFSPNGKLIAIVFYSGRGKLDTKTFLLRD